MKWWLQALSLRLYGECPKSGAVKDRAFLGTGPNKEITFSLAADGEKVGVLAGWKTLQMRPSAFSLVPMRG